MALQSSPHWTENEEVLERYVLGRLDPQAKRVLEEHLEACRECREAVQRETELVAGVRRLGREELKGKLSRRLSAVARPSVPWPHVISAAAVFVIAVGVALYAFWTPLETWYEGSFRGGEPESAEHAAPSPEETAGGREDIARRNEVLLEAIDRAKGDDQKLVEAPAESDRAAAPRLNEEREQKTDATTGDVSALSAWVQGVIVPTTKDEMSHRPGVVAAQGQPTEAKQARKAEGASTVQDLRAELRQQPYQELPKEKQQIQIAGSGRQVETLVEKTPDGLILTLYSDPPIPEEELRVAKLQAVTNDSLLVVMPTQQIAYKIPSSFGSVQGIQLKAK